MKICLTSYYGIRESLQEASDELSDLGHIVIDFSLMKEKNENINYKHKFVEFLIDNKVELILWWYINISVEDMEFVVKSTNITNFFFNWDEPHNWYSCELDKKSKLLDCAFVCCENTKINYVHNGAKKSIYLLPGFSAKNNNLLIDNDNSQYDCDISFICTNLYEDDKEYKYQYINRKILIDNIYNNQEKHNYVFHIYGPEFLKILYPKSYKGFIDYYSQNKLFNNSKINLCTHVSSINYKYLNERTVMIIGSGGLLLIDDIYGLDQLIDKNNDCVILHKDNYINQIVNILDNYDEYIDKRINIYKKRDQFTWKKWAQVINIEIKQIPL